MAQSIGVTPLVGSTHRLLQVVPLVLDSAASGRRLQTTTEVTPSATSIAACTSDTYLPDEANFDGRFNLRASANSACYPLSEAIVLLMRRSFAGTECADVNGSLPLPVHAAQYVQWLTSEANRAPVQNDKMAPLTGLKSTYMSQNLNSLLCDGNAIVAPSPSPPPPLVICPAGNEIKSVNGIDSCVPCPPGKYNAKANSACREAPSIGYVEDYGATGYSSCRANTQYLLPRVESGNLLMVLGEGATSPAQCVCSVGYYDPSLYNANVSVAALIASNFTNATNQPPSLPPSPDTPPMAPPPPMEPGYALNATLPVCLECPEGGVCPGGYIRPYAKVGYAKVSDGTFDKCYGEVIGACDATDLDFASCDCPGGEVQVSQIPDSATALSTADVDKHIVEYRCGDYYVNSTMMCAKCIDTPLTGKYGTDSTGKCAKCTSGDALYFFATVAFVIVWFPVIRYLITRKMRSMYTSLAFVQYIGFYADFNIPWSSDLSDFISFFNSFNLNLNFTHFSCFMTDYEGRWLVQLLLPVLLPIGAAIWCLFNVTCNMLMDDEKQISMGLTPVHDFSVKNTYDRFMPATLFYLNMYMYTGAATALEMLVCRDKDGVKYLAAYPPMTCWEGDHVGYVVIAIFGILFWIVGASYCYYHILYKSVPRMSKTAKGARYAARLYGFLYLRFRPEFWCVPCTRHTLCYPRGLCRWKDTVVFSHLVLALVLTGRSSFMSLAASCRSRSSPSSESLCHPRCRILSRSLRCGL